MSIFLLVSKISLLYKSGDFNSPRRIVEKLMLYQAERNRFKIRLVGESHSARYHPALWLHLDTLMIMGGGYYLPCIHKSNLFSLPARKPPPRQFVHHCATLIGTRPSP